MDLRQLLRLLRAGKSDHESARLLGHNRRTIARYRAWAEEQGLLREEVRLGAEVQRRLAETLPVVPPPKQTSSVARYEPEVADYRRRGLEVAAIRARLAERHEHPVSYSAVWRLVRRLEPKRPETFVRVEVKPGSEAQVDVGYAGLMLDPKTGLPRLRAGCS